MTKYKSIRQCAIENNISHPILHQNLILKGNSGQLHSDEFIFKLDDGTDWPKFTNNKKLLIGLPRFKPLVVQLNNEVRVFQSTVEAANYTSIHKNTLRRKLHKGIEHFILGEFTFYTLSYFTNFIKGK